MLLNSVLRHVLARFESVLCISVHCFSFFVFCLNTRQEGLQPMVHAPAVDPEYSFPIAFLKLTDQAPRSADPGVVAQHVYMPELIMSPSGEDMEVFLLRHVGTNGDCLAALVSKLA